MQRGQERKVGSNESENELVMELKTELATVVEVLCVLHDFIDNLFGVKFQSFCETNFQVSSQLGVLKDLRWKHLGDCVQPKSSTTSTSSAGKSSKGVVSRLPLIIGSPEVVDVKCEAVGDVEVPDFLEDVDPFGGEGEVSSKNYGDDAHHYLSGYEGMADQDIPPYITAGLSSTPDTSSRYSQEYILVENDKDPLQEQEQEQPEEDSSRSSDESADDWKPYMEDPTSAFFNSKKKSKELKLYKHERERQKHLSSAPSPSSSKRARTTNANDKNLYSQQQTQIQLQRQSSTESSKGDGGRFKCDQCPASYSQEESLRSHQKYKHNPSRVQCTCHLCGKSMVDKYRLQRHLRLHTGEKPFSCQYCGQRFYRKDYHTKHMQRKHGLFNSTSTNSSAASKTAQKKATTVSKSTPESSSSTSTTTSKSRGGGGNASASKANASNSSFVAPSSSTRASTSTSHHQSATATSTQSSSSSSTTLTTVVKQERQEENSFLDYFGGGGGSGSGNSSNQPSSSSVPTSSLVTMTSLTFDDLIREDL
ncbi:unnamed protein product [Orchesella dallaii]|uniref:C2H2-type domain-containing protein n=1 Tax=Orchesella dallaii TaxID=48710 RepID=A0ABP1R2Q2_9HEXA